MEMVKEIGKQESVILVIPNNVYSTGILDIAKQLSRTYKNILYISLNKLNHSLIKSFGEMKINPQKFCFIDAITKSAISDVNNTSNCIFLDSTASLTKLSIEIGKLLSNRKIDILLFDSLSTLLIHQTETNVTDFTQFTINKLRNTSTVGVFTVLKEDTDKGLIKNLGMFVDAIIPWMP